MSTQSNPGPADDQKLASRDVADFGLARFRDQIFDAVRALWRRRQSEGWSQKQVAEVIGRDAGWVSRNLRAPGNWTMTTAGELIQGLNGEAKITIFAIEDASHSRSNYDAYDGFGLKSVMVQKSIPVATSNVSPTIVDAHVSPTVVEMIQPSL